MIAFMTPEDAIVATADRIAVLLGSGADPRTPLPGAEWTVGEAAAHLALAGELMADIGAGKNRPYGDGSPAGLAAANRASLAAFPQRDLAVLGAEIAAQARAFVAAAAGRSPREGVLTPMGPMDLATLGSYLLTHLLGHGYDIAAAVRGPHMVDREVVAFTLPFMRLAMPRVVSAGAADHRACYLVRTGRDRFAVTFADGVPTVTDTPPRSFSGAANRGWAHASRRFSQRRRRADGLSIRVCCEDLVQRTASRRARVSRGGRLPSVGVGKPDGSSSQGPTDRAVTIRSVGRVEARARVEVVVRDDVNSIGVLGRIAALLDRVRPHVDSSAGTCLDSVL
ncbi:maleylpyruvate isomerase family mycothiol-dependent enzyme [Streptomyces sp. NPDC088794]|uniref:maleylpyruvate isomerase family mycothiol-dependent enzyme n=1 Tax=Streptomyces sp. NPDC088794 TaxID=3365902 RepID=UPI0037F4CD47